MRFDLYIFISRLWNRADLDTTFATLKSVYLNPKSKVLVRYIYI